MLESIYEMLGFHSQAMPPVVGICGGNADSASVRAMMTQIQSTGAIPLFLGNHAQRDAGADIEKIDALVVMGNNADIDPGRYGAQKHEKTNPESATPEGKARAEYEYALMQRAIEMKMPLLGICGGMQRLNVMLGGTLDQHIADKTGNDDHAQQDHNIAPFIPVQLVDIASNSMLGEISKGVRALYTPRHADFPMPAIQENSMHHQAVQDVGRGLRVSGVSNEVGKDGQPIAIVEAIEADPNGSFKDQFMLGVQWHPEFSASPLGKYIAERVVKEAAGFAKSHSRSHPLSEAVEENQMSMLPMLKEASGNRVAIGGMTAQILARRASQAGAPRDLTA